MYERTAEYRAAVSGTAASGYRHGMWGTPTWHTWHGMIQRCTDCNHDSWAHYGGRGISVCLLWLDFENFLADMGVRPDGMTLDRVDNDGDYEPANCRWITIAEQNRNRTTTKLTWADVDKIRSAVGRTHRQLANEFGVSRSHVTSILNGRTWSGSPTDTRYGRKARVRAV